ncbi:hypothetical protein CRYUN_Cryun09bG0062700 [Craigia yunnanensis]
MLSRLLPKPSLFRLLPLLSSKSETYQSFPHPPPVSLLRFLSTNKNNNNNNNRKDKSFSDPWKFSQESDEKLGNLFSDESENLPGISGVYESPTAAGEEDDGAGKKSKHEDWLVGEEDKAWSFGEEEKVDAVFDLKEEGVRDFGETGGESSIALSGDGVEERKKLEEEEKQLTAVLKGPNRAFGDLIAASGITDAMLDSLIALKDLEGVDGLPPLSVIEDMRYEKNTRKSTRAEIERQKLEEMAKARVRQVDDKGRAYGTGRRKCSIARVWVQPGDGKFIINDKQFDIYFPMLDHRAALLRPFSETKTLGLWDINCTVKGGGVSGKP